MTTREQFELWALSINQIIKRDTECPDDYVNYFVKYSWEGWKACERQQQDTDDLGIAYSLGRADERAAMDSRGEGVPVAYAAMNRYPLNPRIWDCSAFKTGHCNVPLYLHPAAKD